MSETVDIERVDHIGIRVRDLDHAVGMFRDLFDADVGDLVDVPLYDMAFRMCRVGKVDFEVMAPTSTTGVIAKFLSERGEGLHHVAFAVDDLDGTMSTLGGKGVQFVGDPATLPSRLVDYAGRRIDGEIRFAFSHPRSILGILFEFIQYPPDYQTP